MPLERPYRRAPRTASPTSRQRAAPRRDHHGRQRPLGEAAPAAARRRASHAASRRCARRCAHAIERGVEYLTLFAFSSENWRRPAGRGVDPDGPLPARARAGGREAARERHPLQGRRRLVARSTARIRELIAAGEALTAAQHAAHADGRRQLRRAPGHRAGGAALFRRPSRTASTARRFRRTRSTRTSR